MSTSTKSTLSDNQLVQQYRDLARRLVYLKTHVGEGETEQSPSVLEYKQLVENLEESVQSVRQRALLITKSKSELTELDRKIAQCRTEADASSKAIGQLGKSLGETAFQGFLSKELTDLPCFEPRKALASEIEGIQSQQEQLAASVPAGVMEKAKVMAKGAALSGRMMLLKTRIDSVNAVVGNGLLERHEEELVRCPSTENVLHSVAESRSKVESLENAVKDAEQAAAQKRVDVCNILRMDSATSQTLVITY